MLMLVLGVNGTGKKINVTFPSVKADADADSWCEHSFGVRSHWMEMEENAIV